MTTMTHLENFGFLAVRGKDAMKFLQGYTTCDLLDITPERSGLGGICNIQGRMIASFRIVATADGFLLRMGRSLIPAVSEFLQKYIVFSKASLADVSDTLHCYGVIGPVDGFPTTRLGTVRIGECQVIRVSDTDRFEVYDASPPAFAEVDNQPWLAADIDDGLAWVSDATAGEYIPQMFDYHRTGGIDFDKGCYLGQEIVARMQYRGSLNRKLRRGQVRGEVTIGELLLATDTSGKTLGQVVAAAGSHFLAVVQAKDDSLPDCQLVDGRAVALEAISREASGPGQTNRA